MSVTFVDDYAGAGGSSQGLREAGLELVQAANHSPKAIETHATNFPDADHLQTDLLVYNMRRRPSSDLYWASPECTWHSPAGGRKRKRQMLDMFDEYVSDAAGERSRLTMMQVVAFAEAKRPKIVAVENVVEVADWELFESWLHSMTALGYERQILSVSAAHVWSDENRPAPQWRDRVYFVFYQRGINFPDVAPRPWAFCRECACDVRATQAWKRPDHRPIGKYRTQYNYVCPSDGHRHTIVEPYVMPALDALDLSDLGERIGDRKRKLAAATERRIKVGYLMFGEPEIVAHSGQTWDAAKPAHPRFGDTTAYHRAAPASEPLAARTSGPGDAIVHPFLSTVNHAGEDHGRAMDPSEGPLATRSTKLGEGIVTPFMVQRRDYDGADQSRVAPASEPMTTRTASDRGIHGLVSPFIDVARTNNLPRTAEEPIAPLTTGRNHSIVSPYIAEMYGTSTAHSASDPLGAVTAGGNHHGLTTPFLSRQYGSRGADIRHLNTPVSMPLHPITATNGGAHALVTPTKRPRVNATPEQLDAIDISDFRFRMLSWREHASAQRFPRDYIFTGNSSENTLMAGNAVASNVAHYLGILIRVALGDLSWDYLEEMAA